jgi:hypothetical protein
MKAKCPWSQPWHFIITTAFLWTALSTPAQETPQLVTNAPSAGTFFLLSVNPSSPFPFDPYGGALNVYSYDGVFFVDDSQVGDLSLQPNGFGGGMMMNSLGPPGPGGGGTNSGAFTNICSGPTNFTVTYQLSTTNRPPYGTNDLWLEMTVATNNVATLIIHTPNTNAFYDVFGTTNLSPNVLPLNQTNWMWLQRASGAATNFLWTNIIPCAVWFQLGTMLDEDGDGLTTAHEKLVTRTNPNMGDTDRDGLGDRDELLQSRNPLVGDNTSPIIHVVSPTNSLTAQKTGWLLRSTIEPHQVHDLHQRRGVRFRDGLRDKRNLRQSGQAVHHELFPLLRFAVGGGLEHDCVASRGHEQQHE